MTKLHTNNCKELMTEPLKPIEFVINNLITQGLFILAGAPKIGKSWLALDICLSVAKQMLDGLYDRLVEKHGEIKTVVADAGYKTSWICKKVIDNGRIPVLPYKRPMGNKGLFKQYEYVYDIYYDCVLYPENKVLEYSTTNRGGYREFKSKGYICKDCPNLSKCTNNA